MFFRFYFEKSVSIFASESLFPVLFWKACSLICFEKPVSMSIFGKPIPISISGSWFPYALESLFPCSCQKACFQFCFRMPVSISPSESLFPFLFRNHFICIGKPISCPWQKVYFHVYVGELVSMSMSESLFLSESLFPCQCRKACFHVLKSLFPCLYQKAFFHVRFKKPVSIKFLNLKEL